MQETTYEVKISTISLLARNIVNKVSKLQIKLRTVV